MTHWGTDIAVPSIASVAAAVVVVASKSNNLSVDADILIFNTGVPLLYLIHDTAALLTHCYSL